MRNVFTYRNYEELSERAARKILDLAISSKKQRKVFTVAISGGATPRLMFKRLALLKKFPWSSTHFFWADERWVSRKNTRSNFKVFRDQLSKSELNQVQTHPIFCFRTSARNGARLYEGHIMKFFKLSKNKFPKFDLVILGVGEDGHVASLFPGQKELKITNKIVHYVPNIRQNNEERISLSLPLINNARNIMFVVAGKKKAAVVKRVFESKNKRKDSLLPAAKVTPRNGNLIWFLDKEAAVYVV